MANLYLLTIDYLGYDTFDSCVVCAKDETSARGVHPRASWEHHAKTPMDTLWDAEDYFLPVWVTIGQKDKINVKLIGKAAKSVPVGSVVIASFNAG